jgi:uncharacterized membrane protein
MPFCASCGAQVDGGFCAKCGARVGAAAPASGPPVQAAGAMTDNVASALCYVLGLITGILFLLIPPYNRNPAVRFHAFQSIFLNLACFVASIVFNMVLAILHLWELFPIVSLAILAVFIYMVIQAYQGKTIVLPIIGPVAQQQARV